LRHLVGKGFRQGRGARALRENMVMSVGPQALGITTDLMQTAANVGSAVNNLVKELTGGDILEHLKGISESTRTLSADIQELSTMPERMKQVLMPTSSGDVGRLAGEVYRGGIFDPVGQGLKDAMQVFSAGSRP